MLKTLIFLFTLSNFLFFFSIKNESCYVSKKQHRTLNFADKTGTVNTHNIRLEQCDDDGYATFDLTQADTLLVPNENIENFTIKYYQTRQDAIDDRRTILTYQNTIEGAQGNEQLYARITNRTTHEVNYHTVALYVNFPPDIISEHMEILCDNTGTLLLDAGFNTIINTNSQRRNI